MGYKRHVSYTSGNNETLNTNAVTAAVSFFQSRANKLSHESTTLLAVLISFQGLPLHEGPQGLWDLVLILDAALLKLCQPEVRRHVSRSLNSMYDDERRVSKVMANLTSRQRVGVAISLNINCAGQLQLSEALCHHSIQQQEIMIYTVKKSVAFIIAAV
eukprot:scaffold365578_cov36-Prasinocladus_malaysianus.AAC.1